MHQRLTMSLLRLGVVAVAICGLQDWAASKSAADGAQRVQLHHTILAHFCRHLDSSFPPPPRCLPEQVASHAQKYFIRLNSQNKKDKRRVRAPWGVAGCSGLLAA